MTSLLRGKQRPFLLVYLLVHSFLLPSPFAPSFVDQNKWLVVRRTCNLPAFIFSSKPTTTITFFPNSTPRQVACVFFHLLILFFLSFLRKTSASLLQHRIKMRVRTSALVSASLPALAAAGTIPTYDGMTVVFSETFAGNAGDPINTDVWNIATCKSCACTLLPARANSL